MQCQPKSAGYDFVTVVCTLWCFVCSEKDLDEVLQTTAIFSNVGKGVMAAKEDLQVRWQHFDVAIERHHNSGEQLHEHVLHTTWQESSAFQRPCNQLSNCHDRCQVGYSRWSVASCTHGHAGPALASVSQTVCLYSVLRRSPLAPQMRRRFAWRY